MGEIRIVGLGKSRGYPYPVCKKIFYGIRITLLLTVLRDGILFPPHSAIP